jgi:hypothetical protein
MGEVRNDGGPGAGEGQMSRAQMFQDEKRRIMSSCFSKEDSDGACTLAPNLPIFSFVAEYALLFIYCIPFND